MSSPKPKRRDTAQEITDRIVERIEQAGELPWRKPWRSRAIAKPCRHGGEGYRGINHLILSLDAFACGLTSPFWMTYRQAQAYGGQVRKGEKSARVVYFGIGGSRDASGGEKAAQPEASSEGGPGTYRFLKGYAVFNGSQIEGLPPKFNPPEEELDTGARPIPELEAFFSRLPVAIQNGGERACYRELTDDILMPDVARFEETTRYYATLAHEQVHATGIKRRLERECFARYHADLASRAEEELVAELGAAFLSSELGLTPDHLDDHAAYLASWLKALKSDKRYIFRAAADAQKAADWILAAAGEATSPAEASRAA